MDYLRRMQFELLLRGIVSYADDLNRLFVLTEQRKGMTAIRKVQELLFDKYDMDYRVNWMYHDNKVFVVTAEKV